MDTATENKNTDGTQLDKQQIAEFGNQIWCTRVSRVNAEKRLKHKEAFAEELNIYYSCFTVILSISLFLIQKEEVNRLFSAISLTMTVVVTICILYCKSLRYTDRARDYKSNYTELQQLEFSLKHIISMAELKNIEDTYCKLLMGAENHIPYDYYKTILESNKSYKNKKDEKDLQQIRVKYDWGRCWRFAVEVFLVIIPVVVLISSYFAIKSHG